MTAEVKEPLVLAYGMGVDSTAILVGWQKQGIRPDLILFADTGSEKPQTYEYLPYVQNWLASVGFPAVTVVRYQPKNFKNWPPYRTLGENCLTNGTLPSLAFGFKSCSLKWKVQPQNKFTDAWDPARVAWAAGARVTKAIGYDAGPQDSKRYAQVENALDPKYDYVYPLRDWGWDREECKARIAEAGLLVPCKSACFFCPASKPAELKDLDTTQLRSIVAMEARAKPRLREIQGLWRNGCAGKRDPAKKKPGRMTDFIRSSGLLAGAVIDEIEGSTPAELLQFQEAYAEGRVMDELSVWLKQNELRA